MKGWFDHVKECLDMASAPICGTSPGMVSSRICRLFRTVNEINNSNSF